MLKLIRLYFAIRHEVKEYPADHGMTKVSEYWKAMKQDSWWKEVALSDYRQDVLVRR